jgi:choline dehydrogenase-like flavoprotein
VRKPFLLDTVTNISTSQTVVNAPGFTPSSSPDKCYMTIFSSILHPFSSGSVHISSSDPLAYPTIDPRYLNHDIDLDVLELAMKFVRKVCTESAAVKRVGGAKLIEDGNEKLNIRDFVRKKMWTVSPVRYSILRGT